MCYISAITTDNGSEVLVWERGEDGKRDIKYYPAPYYAYCKSSHGEYTSLFGDKLKRITFKNKNAWRKYTKDNTNTLFESDIPPELRVLSAEYHDAVIPKLHMTVFDIEVDYDPKRGFSSPEDPYALINAIALHHIWSNRTIVLAIPPKGNTDTEEDILEDWANRDDIPDIDGDGEFELILCNSERELLSIFLEEIEDSDLLSGWNSDNFDIPYTAQRLKKLGDAYLQKLSFPLAPIPKESKQKDPFGNEVLGYRIFGRSSLDYMLIFKKYEMAGRPSYALEAIADEIVPHLPKLSYTGTLASLYKEDFSLFIRYNVRDTEILKGFEERLGYLELSNSMIHMSTGLFQHVLGTIKLAELSVINYCHYDLGGIIVPDAPRPSDEENKKIKGAFVLIPQKGLHDNVSSVDIASLYPSAIRALNVSPETLIGQFVNNVDDHYEIMHRTDKEITLVMENGKQITTEAKKWVEVFKVKKWAVSGYGTVFNQNKQGVVPMILTDWFAQRKGFKGKMTAAKNEMEEIINGYK
jgi:DNA polymerase elongation subunit (family B)